MIRVNEIAFVAHPVTDKQKARDFYEGIFNLKPTKNLDLEKGFWIEYDRWANDAGAFQLCGNLPGKPGLRALRIWKSKIFRKPSRRLKRTAFAFWRKPWTIRSATYGAIARPGRQLRS